ncbi:hypothetical protein BV898_11321 [Hypsibius exemplaris]|uniref:FAS1 domain-containing protein n=1 Tax=Hypsibius exemplaris TaxID=2072580 RepID=A0A1W0WH06_HYPEX|nr:hypothetical protein BV898_11321 [Hypsibius exemplaris]
MKFLLVLVLCTSAVFGLKKDDLGTGFPDEWYEEAADSAEDDGLSTIPHFMDADEDFAGYFGESEASAEAPMNILEVARKNGATIFVKAAILVGLKDELSNHNDITAFIPSNRAFARLPKLVYLYFLRHPDRLRALLKYHVVKGSFALADLVDDEAHDTLLHNLTVRYDEYKHTKDNRTTRVIQGAHVNCKKNDLKASNGYVHIIDDVILRFSLVDSYEVISKCPAFSTLYNGLVVAKLSDALKSGSLTVFAPTEKAFKRLPAGVWEKILQDPQQLTNVLDLHIVEGTHFARGFRNDDVLPTLNKADSVTITIRHDRRVENGLSRRHHKGEFEVLVNNAKIVSFDGVTTTGVIQAIDKVLLPPSILEEYNMVDLD